MSEFTSKGIRFCSSCSNMLTPLEDQKSLKFSCRFCKYKEQVQNPLSKDENLIYRKEIKDQRSSNTNYDPELVLDATMPRVRDVICPDCGYDEAVYFLVADESDTKLERIFLCGKIEDGMPACGRRWLANGEEILFD